MCTTTKCTAGKHNDVTYTSTALYTEDQNTTVYCCKTNYGIFEYYGLSLCWTQLLKYLLDLGQHGTSKIESLKPINLMQEIQTFRPLKKGQNSYLDQDH